MYTYIGHRIDIFLVGWAFARSLCDKFDVEGGSARLPGRRLLRPSWVVRTQSMLPSAELLSHNAAAETMSVIGREIDPTLRYKALRQLALCSD